MQAFSLKHSVVKIRFLDSACGWDNRGPEFLPILTNCMIWWSIWLMVLFTAVLPALTLTVAQTGDLQQIPRTYVPEEESGRGPGTCMDFVLTRCSSWSGRTLRPRSCQTLPGSSVCTWFWWSTTKVHVQISPNPLNTLTLQKSVANQLFTALTHLQRPQTMPWVVTALLCVHCLSARV